MIRQARNAGAKQRWRALTGALTALSLLFALPAAGAELRLKRAMPADVRTTNLIPGGNSRDTLRLNLVTGDAQYELQLRPKTHLGQLANRVRNQAVAYEGQLPGRPGSWAAITRIGNRWTGLWFDGTRHYGLDSAAALASINDDAAAAAAGRTLVFQLSDAQWEDVDFTGDTRQPTRTAEDFIDQVGAELNAPASLMAVLPTRRLSVALLADAELARQDGPQTEANMLAQLNIVDGIFANQVGVRLQSASSIVFSAGNEPFTATTSSSTLLEQLRDYRSGSTLQRAAGLSHLMTGRNLDGRTVGIAYISSLCSSVFSASLSEARRELTFAALIAAHEIGHVFGAPHDTEAASACESTPSGFLMAPQLNGSQTFSSCSLERIAPVVAAAQCLAPADAADASVEAPQTVSLALNRVTDVTITVHSLGNISTSATNLRITLPLSLTLLDAAGATASCSNASNIVDCSLGSVAPGASPTVTLRLMATTAGTTTATLRVTAANDALRSNDAVTMSLQAAEGTDIAAVASADPAAVELLGTTTATFQLENRGPVAVTDARLAVTIPAGLTLLQQTAENTICAPVTTGITCGPTALDSGATARVVLTLRGDFAGSPALQAVASSSRPELDDSNNNVQLIVTVRSPPPPGRGSSGGGGGQFAPPLLIGFALLWLARLRQRRTHGQARAK